MSGYTEMLDIHLSRHEEKVLASYFLSVDHWQKCQTLVPHMGKWTNLMPNLSTIWVSQKETTTKSWPGQWVDKWIGYKKERLEKEHKHSIMYWLRKQTY